MRAPSTPPTATKDPGVVAEGRRGGVGHLLHVKRRGKLKALVAVARSILVIVWHLLADPTARFHDLGADYHTNHIDKNKKIRGHVRQLQALGFTVTLEHAVA